jgi:hypothetical protein
VEEMASRLSMRPVYFASICCQSCSRGTGGSMS